MKPLQILTEEVNKKINACPQCKGVGSFPEYTRQVCSECKGKCYMIPLEVGCEFIDTSELIDWAKNVTLQAINNSNGRYHFTEKDGSLFTTTKIASYENLGKPLTLQNILLAFDESGIHWESTWEKTIDVSKEVEMGCGCCHEDEVTLTLDLPKEPKDWDDPTLEAIINLIK